ncbi:MAG: hypothetical protein ACKOAD_09215 [Gammaproteobacteria bacterium]
MEKITDSNQRFYWALGAFTGILLLFIVSSQLFVNVKNQVQTLIEENNLSEKKLFDIKAAHIELKFFPLCLEIPELKIYKQDQSLIIKNLAVYFKTWLKTQAYFEIENFKFSELSLHLPNQSFNRTISDFTSKSPILISSTHKTVTISPQTESFNGNFQYQDHKIPCKINLDMAWNDKEILFKTLEIADLENRITASGSIEPIIDYNYFININNINLDYEGHQISAQGQGQFFKNKFELNNTKIQASVPKKQINQLSHHLIDADLKINLNINKEEISGDYNLLAGQFNGFDLETLLTSIHSSIENQNSPPKKNPIQSLLAEIQNKLVQSKNIKTEFLSVSSNFKLQNNLLKNSNFKLAHSNYILDGEGILDYKNKALDFKTKLYLQSASKKTKNSEKKPLELDLSGNWNNIPIAY